MDQANLESIVRQVLQSMQDGSVASGSQTASAAPGPLPTTAHVAVLTQIGHFDIKEYPVPPLGDGDILVKVEGCGVCGTDAHEFKKDPFGLIPVALGHEGTGTIVAMGKNVKKDSAGKDLHIGDKVIVETVRGMEMGSVVMPPIEMEKKRLRVDPGPITRIANDIDLDQEAENRAREREAYHLCRQKIGEHGLEMKLVQAEYTFDRNKLIFYFTADGRVDFRELLKDLASTFHTRIELRQIGVRDETRVLGGIGMCGREVCCKTYLRNFAPVSVKMAKEQNLSLNPTKISGLCGRLMCCLKNEEETYEYLNREMPRIGSKVETAEGEIGTVRNIDILKQKASVLFEENDEREMRVYDVADLKFRARRGKKPEGEGSEEAAEAAGEGKPAEGAAGEGSREGGRDRDGREGRREGRNRRSGRCRNRDENRGGRERNEGASGERNGEGGRGGRENREGGQGSRRGSRSDHSRNRRNGSGGRDGAEDNRSGRSGDRREGRRNGTRRDGSEPKGNRENRRPAEERPADHPGSD